MFVIIGSVTADLMVLSNEPFTSHGSDGFRASNLIFTEKPLVVTMGGNGGNSAYVLAGLGVPTALCGAVGQDPLGDMLAGWLAGRNVDLTGLHRSATHATSTSTIIMTGATDQVVFHHLGSTAQARFEDMPATLFSGVEALLATSFPIMPKLRSGGFARALSLVHQAGGITALDIGPAIGAPATLAELAPLLPAIDYLIANTHELAGLTGGTEWETAARRALAAGARCVVIKQGERGAAAWTLREQVSVPGFRVAANISVGAGDSFNVGLLFALRQGYPLAEALRFGSAVAALVVSSQRGVLDSPTLAQVEEFIRANR